MSHKMIAESRQEAGRLRNPLGILVAMALAGVLLLTTLRGGGAGGLILPWLAFSELAPLGPAGAWHCLNPRVYSYDPRHPDPGNFLLTERPETALARYWASSAATPEAAPSDLTVERVEVNLRDTSGKAVVWARLRHQDGREERRSFLLRGQWQWVSLDLPTKEIMLCQKNYHDWKLIE